MKNIIKATPLETLCAFTEICLKNNTIPYFVFRPIEIHEFFYEFYKMERIGQISVNWNGHSPTISEVRNILRPPFTRLIGRFRAPHYQASVALAGKLRKFPKQRADKARELGESFERKFVCDEWGVKEKVTKIKNYKTLY